MLKSCVTLTDSERQALALSPNFQTPQHWYRVATPTAHIYPVRRNFGIWPAVLLAMVALVVVMALEVFAINPSRPAAILFPEGVTQDQAFLAVVAAGGLPVRPIRSVFSDGVVWIAAADNPDFFSAVRAHGALMAINPVAFGGCLLTVPR